MSESVVQIEQVEVLEWPEARKAEVAEALSHYPNRRSAALPVMWIAQREWGWLSPGALLLVARTVELPESELFGIATFEHWLGFESYLF